MRKNFLEILHGQGSDHVPWVADLTYWCDGRASHDPLAAASQTEDGLLSLCQRVDVMPYFWYGKFWTCEPVYHGVQVDEQIQGDQRVVAWRMPRGELRAEYCRLGETWSEAPARYPVQNEHDLRLFADLLERRELKPINLHDYNARVERWKKVDGVPCLGAPRSPLPAVMTEWTGIEAGTLLTLDHPELMRHVLDLLEREQEPIVRAIAQLHPPVVHFPDNLDSGVYTSLFDEWMLEPYRRRLDALHTGGVACAVHLDGTVRGLLPRLAQTGFDVIGGLTPSPAGDATVEEIRMLAGDHVALWGGLPGAMFAPPFSWEQMKAHVHRTLDAWRGSRFILGIGDQIPPVSDIDWCRRIAELLVESQRGILT